MLFVTQEEELSLKEPLQFLYFYSSSVIFHHKLLLLLEKLEKKHSNVNFFAIDADYFTGLIRRFSVNCVPTFVLIKEQREAERITGFVSSGILTDRLADICKS